MNLVWNFFSGEGDGLLGGLDAGGRVPLSPGRLHDLVLGLT